MQLIHITILFSLLSLQSITAVESTSPLTHRTTLEDFIKKSCQVTLYSSLCYTSLSSSYTGDPNLGKLTHAAIRVSLVECVDTANYLTSLSHQTTTGASNMAVEDCVELTTEAVRQVKRAANKMGRILRNRVHWEEMSSVQTWMSAAITDQNTCMDGFDDIKGGKDGEEVKSNEVGKKVDLTVKLISNALALVNSFVDATH